MQALFCCELASVNCHCGDASNSSLLHGICFLGGLPVDALALLAWQWYLSSRTQHHNFQRLPPNSWRRYHSRWNWLCLGHTLRSAVTTPLTCLLDRLWTPGRLRGRMLQRFREDDLVQREAAAILFRNAVGAARDADAFLNRTPTVPTDLTFTSPPFGSRWFALDDTAGFTTGGVIIIEPDDITSSCGLRVLISRGGITFAHSGCRFGVGCAHLASTL